MIFSGTYLLVRCLLGCLMVVARREASKDAELLVLRHQNAVLRRLWGSETGHRRLTCWFACGSGPVTGSIAGL